MKVLVAYGTKYGATAGIADKIGQVLQDAGLQADVLRADQVRDLADYQAVVLGSAVYIGKWRKEAARFFKSNEKALSERPVWLFSSGPTEEGDPIELMEGWRFPKALQSIADRIQPRDITVFHGVMDETKLNPLDGWMIKRVKAQSGDFRDWDAIASWVKSIADALKEPES